MKRIKYLFLLGILACTTGCKNENVEMVPIDDSNEIEIVKENEAETVSIWDGFTP